MDRTQEVAGSSPASSTSKAAAIAALCTQPACDVRARSTHVLLNLRGPRLRLGPPASHAGGPWFDPRCAHRSTSGVARLWALRLMETTWPVSGAVRGSCCAAAGG